MSTFIDILPYATALFSLLLLVWLVSQELRLRRFFAGKNARSLEETLSVITRHLGKLEEVAREHGKSLSEHDGRIGSAIRFVKTVRFNPWEGTGEGGNQSFASVFLDEAGNGAVISTLYTRERTSVYGKPIIAYGSPFPLTKEERAVVTDIKNQKPKIENKS